MPIYPRIRTLCKYHTRLIPHGGTEGICLYATSHTALVPLEMFLEMPLEMLARQCVTDEIRRMKDHL